MASPDFNIVRNDPGKRSYDARIGEERPVGVPQTKKDFKVLLRKDPEKEEDDQGQGKQVKQSDVKPEEKTPTKKVKEEMPETKASIFTLSEDAAKSSAVVPKEPIAEGPPTGEKLVPLLKGKVPTLPEKEASKAAIPNLYLPKEKKVSSSMDVPIRGRGKAKQPPMEEKVKPLIAHESDEGDISQFLDEHESEEHVAINPDVKKKQPEPVIAYREPDHVPIVNNAKTAPAIERPSAPKELPSIYSPLFNDKKEEHKISTKFNQEQPDLAYVNPMHMNIQASSSAFVQTATVPRPVMHPDTELLFTQMVDKMTTLSNEGKTDTNMVLKHPPLFEGATLKITSFQSARGEFNISFENLKPEALKLFQASSEGLKTAMQNKGFTIHIISATTVDTPIHAAEAQAGREQAEQQRQQQQQQQQQQQKEEEFEG